MKIPTKVIHIALSLYVVIRKRKNPFKEPSDKSIYQCSMEEMNDKINSMVYLPDRLNGLLDRTDDPDTFFDSSKISDRDCDDFARQWSLWGFFNDYTAWECIVLNANKPFATAHVITILQSLDTRKYWLMNYEPFGEFDTFEEAVDYMKWYPSYKDGELVWKISDQL
jgi:hypothetical protein